MTGFILNIVRWCNIALTILFFLYAIMLSIIGIENFFAIAFLCAILNIIPYLGPLVSIILMIY